MESSETIPLLGRSPEARSRFLHRYRSIMGDAYRSIIMRDMIKAVLAFSITLLITFLNPIHEYVGFYSHMSTVSIFFFHPCKSMGGMFEAVIMGGMGIVFGAGVSMLAVSVAASDGLFGLDGSMAVALQVVSLTSLIFISTFLLSFLRARSSRPPVYTGTIIAHLIIFITLTGTHLDVMRIKSIITAVSSGMAVSLLVNFFLWPKTATYLLRRDVSATMFGIENLLSTMVSAFLLDETEHSFTVTDQDPTDSFNVLEEIETKMERHQLQFIHLTRSNTEARMEFGGFAGHLNYWNSLIASLNRLSRHLGGLRSSILKLSRWDVQRNTPLHRPLDKQERVKKCDVKLLNDMLSHFHDPINILAAECRTVILDLERLLSSSLASSWLFHRQPSCNTDEQLQLLVRRIDAALAAFDASQKAELLAMFEAKKYDGRPADEVFLVFYFVFCLLELGKEIKMGLIPRVAHLCGVSHFGRAVNRTERPKTWFETWISGSSSGYETALEYDSDEEDVEIDDVTQKSDLPRFLHPNDDEEAQPSKSSNSRYFEYLQSQTNDQYHHYLKSPSASPGPGHLHHTRSRHVHNLESFYPQRDTPAPPVQISFFIRHRLRLWHLLSNIRNSFNIKFALKTSLVVTVLALFAFLPLSSGVFHLYRAQWAMISIVVVMSPTVGGTNVAGFYRVLGTCFGAIYAFVAHYFVNNVLNVDYDKVGKWLIFAALTLFSVPCFGIFLYSKYPRVGQVAMVTVCAIALAHESNRGNPEWNVDIKELAMKQGLMVTVGIFLGLVVNWYVWPFEARVELRKGLSDLMLNMGILYSRLVEVFNYPTQSSLSPSYQKHSTVGNIGNKMDTKRRITASTVHNYYYTKFETLTPSDTYSYFVAFELKLHMTLLRLDQLIPLTWLEPRLKGPFPVEIYRQMVKKCMLILDKFAAMRIALSNHLRLNMPDEYEDESGINGHGNNDDDGTTTVSENEDEDNDSNSISQYRQRSKTMPDLHRPVHSDLILGPARMSRTHRTNAHLSDIPLSLMPYRKEMVGAVLQSFYIYSGSLILKQPLPTYLPPMKEARQRLMDRMHTFMRSKNGHTKDDGGSSAKVPMSIALPEQFINYYAYSLAMEDVIVEVEELGKLLKSLFGEMFADVIFQMPSQPSEAGASTSRPTPTRPKEAHANQQAATSTDRMQDSADWWRSSGNWML